MQVGCKCTKAGDKNCASVRCKVDKDDDPAENDVFFNCTGGATGTQPVCDYGPLDQVGIPCVAGTIQSALKEWSIGTEYTTSPSPSSKAFAQFRWYILPAVSSVLSTYFLL